jgi:hypothetical protein
MYEIKLFQIVTKLIRGKVISRNFIWKYPSVYFINGPATTV